MAAVIQAAKQANVFALAAFSPLAQKPHQGHQPQNSTFRPGTTLAISNTATSFPDPLYDFCVGPRCSAKERDAETGLDFFEARYMSSAQGRFTSPDPSGLLSAKPADPQSWNLYAYVRNNPLVLIDPNGLDCVNATDSQGGFAVNHDTNSGDCGKGGGTWVPGYVDESWVSWNKKTGQYQVASIDAAGSYAGSGVFDSTIDYATFKAGATTDENGKCLSGCKGYGFASASTDWLESQFVGRSGLNGYLGFLAGRDQQLSLFSQIAYGGLASWKNHWAGPGGMGAPGGRGDWAASVHDFNFDQNGPIHIDGESRQES